MKRVLTLLFLIVFAAAGFAKGSTEPAGSADTAGSADPTISADGTLVYAEGRVTMDGKLIEIGAKIINGSLLETDGDGIAEIVFGKKNIVKLGPSTKARLELGSLNRVVTVENGSFAAVLRKLDKLAGGGLEIKTASMVAGVRGTSFFVRVDEKKAETYICACNGRLSLSASDNSASLEKASYHHDATLFTGTPGTVAVSKPGAGYNHGHTDEDLEKLAARIGEKMNWTAIE